MSKLYDAETKFQQFRIRHFTKTPQFWQVTLLVVKDKRIKINDGKEQSRLASFIGKEQMNMKNINLENCILNSEGCTYKFFQISKAVINQKEAF